jgi:hypothetical protein
MLEAGCSTSDINDKLRWLATKDCDLRLWPVQPGQSSHLQVCHQQSYFPFLQGKPVEYIGEDTIDGAQDEHR